VTALFIDSDVALGSPFGDVDDAYAIAAVLRSRVKVEALSAVFGNSFEPWAHRNLKVLAPLCGYEGPILHGASTWWARESEASRFLASLDRPVRVLALGPLTNLALALRTNPAAAKHITEIILVATNLSVRWPAARFVDFNQWKDPRALRAVLGSSIPLTIVPCDVARRLRATSEEVAQLPGQLGAHLSRYSRRWFLRARWLKHVDSVPIWDLSAALFAVNPALFETKRTTLALGRLGQAHYGARQGRPVQIVTGFDPPALWAKFRSTLS